jgi:hypothetical protein
VLYSRSRCQKVFARAGAASQPLVPVRSSSEEWEVGLAGEMAMRTACYVMRDKWT